MQHAVGIGPGRISRSQIHQRNDLAQRQVTAPVSHRLVKREVVKHCVSSLSAFGIIGEKRIPRTLERLQLVRHLHRTAQWRVMPSVHAVTELRHRLVEIAAGPQIKLRHRRRIHLDGRSLVTEPEDILILFLQNADPGIRHVQQSQTGHVVRFQPGDIHLHRHHRNRSDTPLCQCVPRPKEILCRQRMEPELPTGQFPFPVHRLVVPLPDRLQVRTVEAVIAFIRCMGPHVFAHIRFEPGSRRPSQVARQAEIRPSVQRQVVRPTAMKSTMENPHHSPLGKSTIPPWCKGTALR